MPVRNAQTVWVWTGGAVVQQTTERRDKLPADFGRLHEVCEVPGEHLQKRGLQLHALFAGNLEKWKCQAEFCWKCLIMWKDHPSDHYTCNNPPAIRQGQTNAEFEVQRYEFYSSRYKVNEKQQLQLRQLSQKLPAIIGEYREKFILRENELDFFESALGNLSNSRQVLPVLADSQVLLRLGLQSQDQW